MAVVAIGMATGYHARWAAALLLAAGPLGMMEFGFLPVAPARGHARPRAVRAARPARAAGRPTTSSAAPRTRRPAAAGQAVWALKVCAGLALIVVAFAEKLAVPGMALDFLAHHPQFNLAQQVGLGWSDLEFARVAGAIEVLFGLLVISGRALAGLRADRGHPVQRDALVLRHDGARRPPAGLRRDAGAARLRLGPGAAAGGQLAVAVRGRPLERVRAALAAAPAG